MTAPGNSVVLLILLASFVGSTGYAAGRLHQWYRMDQERDEAYRVGYDMATRNVFSLAARMIGPRRERAAVRGSASVHRSSSVSSGSPSPSESPVVSGDSSDRHDGSAGSRGRHTVPDELVQAATYRLTPDRVARAKVRQKPAADLPDDQTSRLPELPNGVSVPKPRSS